MADERESVLAGLRILVTRALAQSQELCRQLEMRGARPILCPMLRFALPEDTSALDAALRNLSHFDWWLLTSQNAVDFAAQRCAQLSVNLADAIRNLRVAAVGPATAEAARKAGLRVDVVAREHIGLKLADELGAELRGKKVLLLRSDLADSKLPVRLRELGADVFEVVAYRTLPPGEEESQHLRSVPWNQVDAALLFSPSAIRHFAAIAGLPLLQREARHVLFVAIGPVTLDAMRELGIARTAQAPDASVSAILDTLEQALSEKVRMSSGAQNR